MIISASRRTDIPAFYSRWLLRRLEEGEVLVRNPVRPGQVSRISLAPENVDALVFWTKNPAPFLPQLPVIASMGYSFYVLFTITPYGERIEPGVPGIETRVEVFRALSRLLGRERVIWRYDPVILGGGMDADWHAGAFRYLASRLSGSTCRCMFSFLDDYRKTRQRMAGISGTAPDLQAVSALAGRFARAAAGHGISLFTCSHAIDLSCHGIMHGCCIDPGLIELIAGRRLSRIRKDRGQRKACGCAESRDIGSYDTCQHGCRYCYAVSGRAGFSRGPRCLHDPGAPMLCDRLRGDETVFG